MVPFLRGVRVKKKSREATHLSAAKCYSLQEGSPELVSFRWQSCLNRWNFLMKLGINGVLAKPHGMALPFLDFAARGMSYLVRKVKKWVFWTFSGNFDCTKGPKRG